jgi:hypothetical protein
MTKFYDTALRYMIPSNSEDGNIVLNKAFDKWNAHIYTNLYTRKVDNTDYSSGKDKKLLEECVAHRDRYRNQDYCKDIIVMTHPLYMYLSAMNLISTPRLKKDADTYLNNLLSLFEVERKDKFSIVLLDNVHDYAAATSLFLENNKVDDVIFTKYSKGEPLDTESLVPFRHKNVYIGGGYNGQCLKSSILDMRNAQFNCPEVSYGNLLVIKDMVLDSPAIKRENSVVPRRKLFPRFVKGVSLSDTASMNEVLKYLDVIPQTKRTSIISGFN